ncbi:MAG: alpha/beta hydrolase [Bacteroidia bacterium]|nr:alpha/beta hydrolase [Bacteroidia bacterium]
MTRNLIKTSIILFFLTAFFPAISSAQNPPLVVPLWAKGAPGFENRKDEPEQAQDWWVRNVHNPSITVYLPPREIATGTAVVICPGGGHQNLVFNAEGRDAAAYFNSIGVAAFVLKYRLAREANSPYSLDIHPQQDGYRAMRLVRSRAAEWEIDSSRIGIMGFSAGGEVVSMVAYGTGEGDPKAADPVDRVNGRPDFQILIYPGPLGIPDVIPATAPPAFLAVANDDNCCLPPTMKILVGYQAAGVKVEAHIYSHGGHAFNMGLRTPLITLQTWPQRLTDWMKDNELL